MTELTNLRGYFKNRGYPDKLIDPQINKALNYNGKTNKTDHPPTLIVTFHPQHSPFAKTIGSVWGKYRDKIQHMVDRPIVAYRRPQNLKDTLVHAAFNKKTPPIHRKQPPRLRGDHTQHIIRLTYRNHWNL